MKVGELQALLGRFAKIHRDAGATMKAKALEDLVSVFDAAKSGVTVQTLLKKLKPQGGVGRPRRVR